jgi:hypothetical protein
MDGLGPAVVPEQIPRPHSFIGNQVARPDQRARHCLGEAIKLPRVTQMRLGQTAPRLDVVGARLGPLACGEALRRHRGAQSGYLLRLAAFPHQLAPPTLAVISTVRWHWGRGVLCPGAVVVRVQPLIYPQRPSL